MRGCGSGFMPAASPIPPGVERNRRREQSSPPILSAEPARRIAGLKYSILPGMPQSTKAVNFRVLIIFCVLP
jgi:hypothetical protein